MLKRILVAFVVVASALFVSCIKEDVSRCSSGLQLKFSYLLNSQGANLFGDEVEQMTVFAFDADGRYLATFSDAGSHLTNDYVMTLPLPVGRYTLLSWGGDMAQYNPLAMIDENADVREPLTKGVTTLEQFRLLVKQMENTEALGLYYGKAQDVESKTTGRQTYPIELIKNSNTIRVHFTGIENMPQGAQLKADQTSLFDVTITAQNGRYDHENNIPSAAKTVLYKPHTISYKPNDLIYDSNVLRLMIGRRQMLHVVNNQTGKEICNFNIVEAIMKDPKYKTQEDIDRVDFFPFEFNIGPDMSVNITINGWTIIDVIPEL